MTRPFVFVSYSHKNETEKDKLLSHLGVLQSAGLIYLWNDDQIKAGAPWEEDIRRALDQARVAVLLISDHFLNSEFILNNEIPEILENRERTGLTIFPVIATACAWQEVAWLHKLNVRPKNGKPVWGQGGSHVDEDLAAIAAEVAAIVKETGKRVDPPLPAEPFLQTNGIRTHPLASPRNWQVIGAALAVIIIGWLISIFFFGGNSSNNPSLTPTVTTTVSMALPTEELTVLPTPTATTISPSSPSPALTNEPTVAIDGIAVISSVKGKVKVQRQEEWLISAVSGLVLLYEDVVTSLEQSEAYIYCLRVGLFKLSPGRAVILTCDLNPPEGLDLILTEPSGTMDDLASNAAASAPPSLASLNNVRGARSRSLADLGNVPILLSPRQSAFGPQPVFRWTTVTGAEFYTLNIAGRTDEWEVSLAADKIASSEVKPFVISDTAILETVYPAQAPTLKPGTTYIITLQAHLPDVATPQEATEPLFFELVDNDTAATLADTATKIQELAVPEDEKTFLLARLYQDRSLWSAAAHELETLAQRNPQSPPLIQLGELYLKVGLTDLAEANLQLALEKAQADDDLYTEAAALTGLGQTAYAARADDEAVEYFEQALVLYHRLGAETQASTVKDLLVELR